MDVYIYGVVAEGPGQPYKMFTLRLSEDINLARLRVLVATRLGIDPNSWLAGQLKLYRFDEVIHEEDERLQQAEEHPNKSFKTTPLPESLQSISSHIPDVVLQKQGEKVSGVHILVEMAPLDAQEDDDEETIPMRLPEMEILPPAYSQVPGHRRNRSENIPVALRVLPTIQRNATHHQTRGSGTSQHPYYPADLKNGFGTFDLLPYLSSTDLARNGTVTSNTTSQDSQSSFHLPGTSYYLQNPDYMTAYTTSPQFFTPVPIQPATTAHHYRNVSDSSYGSSAAEDRNRDSYSRIFEEGVKIHARETEKRKLVEGVRDEEARRRKKMFIGIGVGLLVILVLSIGLGVGLNNKNNGSGMTASGARLLSPPSPGVGQYGLLPGFDWIGSDLATPNVTARNITNLNDCWQLCRDTPGCAVAVSDRQSKCALKSEIPKVTQRTDENDPRIILFPLKDTSWATWPATARSDHRGDDIACFVGTVVTAEDCGAFCVIHPQCRAFNYNEPSDKPLDNGWTHGGCCLKTNGAGKSPSPLVTFWDKP
ncbi:hypothetical protein DFS34DRAFT_432710 [Phlyctochytrium arcticum]|nr:hypothetical protein DFS34DRAFT_432710 [Phlyctochytrium arcticum]